MSNNVLVIAPHPDDEAIGCGGAIAKHVLSGDVVRVLFVSDGEKGIPGKSPADTRLIRIEESYKAQEVLGYQELKHLHYPDGELENHAKDIEHDLKASIAWIGGTSLIVYAPHQDEAHVDHSIVSLITMNVVEELNDVELRMYEVWTPLQRILYRLDITKWIDYKRNAIRAYQSQDSRNSYSEAVLALNHYRGLLHGPAMMYCEVFRGP